MADDKDELFLDNIDSIDEIDIDIVDSQTAKNIDSYELDHKALLARKKIDTLLEAKRLKDLLDNSEDW